jgi:DNA-binding GntR family transcriptional regulator
MSSRKASQTISTQGLTQGIYKLLRARIASHEYAAGERLQLDPLATRLGVSRTPVREALNQLAAEGLIEIRPRRGTFVAEVTPETVAELYQLRLMIDTFVGKVVASRITSRQLDILRNRLDKMAHVVDGDTYLDFGTYLEHDRAFHSSIVRLVGNGRLTALYEEINLPLWLVRVQRAVGPPRDAATSLAQHRAILEALASRDPRAAAEAMAAHIESSLRKLGVQLTPAAHAELLEGPTVLPATGVRPVRRRLGDRAKHAADHSRVDAR